jgi:hypothetical protein
MDVKMIAAQKIEISEFVTGEKFEALCDVNSEKDSSWQESINKCDNPVITFFSQTHELCNKIPVLARMDEKFIVVSHNSDGSFQRGEVKRNIDFQWKNYPNILHWYCQNCEVGEPNVTPIMIGVENTYIFKPEIKQQYMIDLRDAGLKKEIKVFICYNPETNPGERKPPLKLFEDKPWVTIASGFNNIDLIKPFFDQMIRHQFVLCPDGNGMDTHRLWEALYIGCIPIVKPHVFTNYFAKHLPIIVVKNWEEITMKFLINKLQEIDETKYNWDMLKMSYWKKDVVELKRG